MGGNREGRLPQPLLAEPQPQRSFAWKASGFATGSVTVPVANPNAFKAKGSLELRLGKQRLGQAALAVPAHGERKLTVTLGSAAQAALKRSGAKRIGATASFRDPAGRAHRTSASVSLAGTSGGGATPPGTPNGPSVPAETPIGPDGTYHGADGLTVVVAEGKVVAFNGQVSTYCTVSEEQKSVSFGMFGTIPTRK